jgi:ketosteroid isomerase-like protein
MSQENVEAVRASYEALQRGDLETAWAGFDPEIEWDFSAYPLPGVASQGRGRENFLRFIADYTSIWTRYESSPKELIDAGDKVVVVLDETVWGRGSDTPIHRDLFLMWAVRDGKAVKLSVYETKAEALGAAGLRE